MASDKRESQLQALIDRQAINDLVVRYFVSVDRRDFATTRETFLPDARCDYSALLPIEPGCPADQIIDLIESAIDKYSLTVHTAGNHEIVLDGDRARSEVWATAIHTYREPNRDGGRIPLIGLRYQSDVVRVGDDWKFAQRTAFADWRSFMEPRRDRYADSGDVS